ncbi:MAG: flagellar hook-basal body complex protein FliE [Thermaurantiacus sp.]
MSLRQRILERNQALAQALSPQALGKVGPSGANAAAAPDFGQTMARAIEQVNALQGQGAAASAAYERGETQDIASVMLARQKASIAFEATLQARNRLLSAYRDIMNMPV